MSQIDNLIDFNSESLSVSDNQICVSMCSVLSPEHISIGSEENNEKVSSPENNPFDTALEQSKLQDDPFEIVMHQAEVQKYELSQRPEVETVDLLGLIGEPNEFETKGTEEENAEHHSLSPTLHVSTKKLSCSTHGSYVKDESEAPVVTNKVGSKLATIAAQPSDDIRTKLLKLSVTNSPLDSPLRRDSKTSEESFDSANSKKGSQKINFNEFNDSSDDINALKPNWVDSETELDSDLELLNIPILQRMDKDAERKLNAAMNNKDNVEAMAKSNHKTNENEPPNKSTNVIDLQMIRDRVRRHNLGKNNTHDVDDVISSMKKIVLECEDEEQKNEANRLLESLSALLSKKNVDLEKSKHDEQDAVQDQQVADDGQEIPQPIVRQGTFDMDKTQKSNTFISDEKQCLSPNESTSTNYGGVNAFQPGVSMELSNMVEQIGMLFGNQNINVLQTNIGSTDSNASKPTYIVVMGNPNSSAPFTPVRQNTQILENSTYSPEFSQQARNRSHSLSIHDKPIKRRTIITPSSPSVFNTPTRPNALKRRSTISFSPSNVPHTNTRKSICNPPSVQKPITVQRRPSLNSERDFISERSGLKHIPHVKVDSNASTLKLKSGENIQRKVGPIKATLPIKAALPSISTSLHYSSKAKLISLPITPVACSTPSAVSPPDNNCFANKFRSPLSVTPKPKANTKSNLGGVYRRRSLTDSKSPKRGSNAALSSRLSTGVHQFIRRSTLNVSGKSLGVVQPKNKENNPPK